MDKFHTITLQALALIGVNYDFYHGRKKIVVKFLFGLNIMILCTAMTQELTFVLDDRNTILDRLVGLPVIFCVSVSYPKYGSVIYYKNLIKSIMLRLDEIYERMENEEKFRFEVLSYQHRKLAVIFAMGYMIALWNFNLLPILEMILTYQLTGESVKLRPFMFNYPFDANKYYVLTYIHECICGQFSTLKIVFPDVLYMMILSMILAHFKHLSDNFKNLINQAASDKKWTKKNQETLKYLIGVHESLNEFCITLNRIYGFPLLVHFIVVCFMICFSGLLIVTQDDLILLSKFILFLVVVLVQSYFLCWFGNKIDNEVRK